MVLALVLAMAPQLAQAQTATMQVDRQLFAELPFAVNVVAEGFDDSPQPEQPELVIAGCKVRALGVTPNVTSMTIVRGRRIQSRQVTLVYRWRVEAPAAGTYQVPAITIRQGGKKATTQPRPLRVGAIPTTDDMLVELELPARKVWVGETFPVHLDWYLRKEPRKSQLVVPLFDLEDTFRVTAPTGAAGADTMNFPAGAAELELPFAQERTQVNGRDYTRVRFTAMVTAVKPGTLELPPARAVAQLEVGSAPDRWGFSAPRFGLFKAADQRRRLEVAALPLAGRPPSFSNAVGGSFSIAVQADRTVVRVGDPIRLDITVRSDTRLDGLILPRLDVPGGVDPSRFSVPADPPVGRLVDDSGTTKAFMVTVQVQSLEARTIPPIQLSYFDPAAGTYRTVTSKEIALQVAGAAVVGAGDVVGAPTARAGAAGTRAGLPADVGSAAALSLSAPGDTLAGVTSVARVRPLIIALYALPLLLLGTSLWWRRTARGWAAAARARGKARPGATAALLVLAGLGAVPGDARADESSADPMAEARGAYQEAMEATDRELRIARFARAAALLGELAAAHPDRPELLADWGNAAIGAGDPGTAVLAWRRALRLDPGHARARTNLSWVREQSPAWVPRPPARGAVDTLFFWHQRTTRAQRHLAAAGAFALAVLLWIPWAPRRRTLLRRLSILPAALWVALVISLVVERDQSRDAVVIAGEVVLRSADSSGAPAALPSPLPAGAEVTIHEQRDAWTRIALADGTTGWLPSSAVAPVIPD